MTQSECKNIEHSDDYKTDQHNFFGFQFRSAKIKLLTYYCVMPYDNVVFRFFSFIHRWFLVSFFPRNHQFCNSWVYEQTASRVELLKHCVITHAAADLQPIEAWSDMQENIFCARNCEATRWMIISEFFLCLTQQRVLNWSMVQVWHGDQKSLHFLSNVHCKIDLCHICDFRWYSAPVLNEALLIAAAKRELVLNVSNYRQKLSNLRKMYLSFHAWVCEWLVINALDMSRVRFISITWLNAEI